MRLLLLANSLKNAGRCLAGLNDDGIWIRPVASDSGGAISNSVALGTSPLVPLDIIEFDSLAPKPLPHHGENYVIDERSIRKTGRSTTDDAALAKAATEIPWFMSSEDKSIPASAYEGHVGAVSLGYIIVADFRAVKSAWGKWRARFSMGGSDFDLALTDDLFTSHLTRNTQPRPAGLCLSVAEQWEGSHYKLVAGVVLL